MFLLAGATSAQTKITDRIELGGSFGINVQNRMGAVEFSPIVGYQLFKGFTVNAGFIACYAWNKDNDMTEWNYGLTAGARYVLFDFIYVEGRYVFNPYTITYKAINTKEHGVEHGMWIGAGFRKKVATNTYTYAGIVYDVLHPAAEDNPRFSVGATYLF